MGNRKSKEKVFMWLRRQRRRHRRCRHRRCRRRRCRCQHRPCHLTQFHSLLLPVYLSHSWPIISFLSLSPISHTHSHLSLA